MRRFCIRVIRLEIAARHLAFVARFRNRRSEDARTPALGQVLRRSLQRVLQQVRIPLHFALHLFQRAAAPWNPPLPLGALSSPDAARVITHERSHRITSVVERASRVLHMHHSQHLVTVASPAIAVASSSAPSTRILVTQRIERQTHFPRVTQIVTRSPAGLVTRSEAALPASPLLVEPRRAPRASAPSAAVIAAAPALLPAELSRVTDHVIQQLDRRVLSYRERTGQV